jgi:hypothetical protein
MQASLARCATSACSFARRPSSSAAAAVAPLRATPTRAAPHARRSVAAMASSGAAGKSASGLFGVDEEQAGLASVP